MGSASTDSLSRYWISLPEKLKAKLRLGFTDLRHLLDIAGWCIRSEDPALTPIAADAINTVVRENPLDGAMTLELLALGPVRALLDKPTMDRLLQLTGNWRLPGNIDTYRQVQMRRDFAEIKHFIHASATEQPGNLFWTEQAIMAGLADFDTSFIAKNINSDTLSSVELVKSATLTRLDSLLSGQDGPATGDLPDLVARSPWNTSLALNAHDRLAGLPERREPLPGSVAVLLYSWSKADELDATLASLAESGLNDASVFVLDNGSTDRTGEVLREYRSRFEAMLGTDRFTTVTLPVNIGAAAARNWLLHMEAVQAHGFICYLDDDIELPADWMQRFGAAVAEYPDAGVWGCKAVDHASHLVIQSADNHLLPAQDQAMDLTRMSPHRFGLSDLHIQTLDSGTFDFLRPCASVTGCCHLFRTETLLKSGDFAIQLSPSQYDDMEHDLRLCKAGLFPVYQGHLAVRHKKRSGAASRINAQDEGNAMGNKYKMQTMHDPAEIAAASAAEQKLLDEDILRKLAYLDNI